LATFCSPVEADALKLERLRGWFGPLSAYADRLAAWECLAHLLAESPLLENLARLPEADQRLANVRKLLRLASERPELGPDAFAESVREVNRFRHQEGNAPIHAEDGVASILTIHKSKGLEFDNVVIPFLPEVKKSPSFLKDRTDGYLGESPRRVPMDAHVGHVRQQEEQAESFRKLYVAMTRAKRRLAVAVPADQASKPHWKAVLKSPTLRVTRRSAD
jgi:ATP-dependent exoDNAse (exonuclease V) beta subunit